MQRWCVGHIDWSENELRLEIVQAADWHNACAMHSMYPWRDYPNDAPSNRDEMAFKQTCFDCDCMMNWIAIP